VNTGNIGVSEGETRHERAEHHAIARLCILTIFRCAPWRSELGYRPRSLHKTFADKLE
jgi:hypothetical protein